MASNVTFHPLHRYRLIDQRVALERDYPDGHCSIRRGVLRWTGIVQPTALSRTYCIAVEYRMRRRPVVLLHGDNIKGLDRSDFPHHFWIDREKKSVSLCLHLPYEFNSTQLISESIVPWAIEWLYFYEIWLTTGEWCGGGMHASRVQ